MFKVTLFGGNALLHPTPPGLPEQSPVLHPVTPLDTTTASCAAASWEKTRSRGLSWSSCRCCSTGWATTVTASTCIKRIERMKTCFLRQLKTKAPSLPQRSSNYYTSQSLRWRTRVYKAKLTMHVFIISYKGNWTSDLSWPLNCWITGDTPQYRQVNSLLANEAVSLVPMTNFFFIFREK